MQLTLGRYAHIVPDWPLLNATMAGPMRLQAMRQWTFIGVVLTACGDADEPTQIVRSDSAGIEIVHNLLEEAERDPWHLVEASVPELGGLESPPLYRVIGAVFLPGGRIAVGNAGSSEILWFSPDGSVVARAGREGDGPGEFRSLSFISAVGDSVFAWDRSLRRLSVFRNGALLREAAADIPDDRPLPQVRGILASGDIVAVPGPTYVPETTVGVQRPPIPVWLLTGSGAMQRTLGTFPGDEVNLTPASAGQAWIRTAVPYGASTLVAGGADIIVVVDNSRFELRLYDRTGDLLRVARVDVPRQRVGRDALAAELERRLASLPPVEEIRAGIRVSFEETPAAELAPSYADLFVAEDGAIWAGRTALLPSDPQRWDVYNSSGAWLGSVTAPPGVKIMDVSGSNAAALFIDDLGVERVRQYTLQQTD